jgi:hypothetical protein
VRAKRALYAAATIAAGIAAFWPAQASPPAAIADPSCGLEDPAIAARAPAVPKKPREVAGLGASGLPLVRRERPARAVALGTVGRGAHGGALAGKTVYVSAGHGWTWVDSLGSWRTQRGNTHDLVEDFISAETVDQYLLRYLINMGAHVVPVREPDLNSAIDVVDDASRGDRFVIEGSPVIVIDDSTAGYGIVPTPITGATNPFAAGTATAFETSAQETARATWVFDVPSTGEYNLYVGYVQDPTRASDAHYIVRHTGGETSFRVDQRRHGSTWVLLGRFHFEAGVAPTYGSISLVNDSADAGTTVSADAVRIGGGVGVIDRGGGANGRPMFENNARYNAQLSGAPSTVWDYSSTDGNDDVGTRSRFAAWDHEDGEDAVYIAWHTNAPSPARGTSSFAYGPEAFGDISQFTGVPGSLELMDAIHNELVGDFRAVWQSDWQDRGQHTAYFGEVNPSHNPEMPAVLFEIAFHDTAEDADALRDPRFRSIAARAMAQGVARYFASRDGRAAVLPPEPPVDPAMVNSGDGALTLTWRPPVADAAGGDAATGYVVYLSPDGRGFDEGTVVDGGDGEQFVVVDRPVGAEVYARVTAINDGGESFPTGVVGARVSSEGRARVLVVGGFDRLDGRMLIREDLSAHALATIERGLIDRINDRSHAARHGAAIASADISFDAATAGAVAAGDVDLSRYEFVDWFLGEETSEQDPIDAAERDALSAYLAGGGSLLLTGSEVGWSLVAQGLAPEFFTGELRADYVADDAETYALVGVAAPFADLPSLSFDDFGPGSYDADWPDAIAPLDGGEVVLRYEAATGTGAATMWSDAGGTQHIAVFGFPFETIVSAPMRGEVMRRVLGHAGVPPDEQPAGPDAGPDDDGGGGITAGCGCRTSPSPSRWPWLPFGVFSVVLWVLWRARMSSSRRRPSQTPSNSSRR